MSTTTINRTDKAKECIFTLHTTRIESEDDAVRIINIIAPLEAEIKRLKEEANELLNLTCPECDKITTKDGFYSVIRVPMNEIVYNQTRQYMKALTTYEEAALNLKHVQLDTPFSRVPKGKGYYYKASK